MLNSALVTIGLFCKYFSSCFLFISLQNDNFMSELTHQEKTGSNGGHQTQKPSKMPKKASSLIATAKAEPSVDEAEALKRLEEEERQLEQEDEREARELFARYSNGACSFFLFL